MFAIGLLIMIYAYCLFFLGITHLLEREYIFILTILFFIISGVMLLKSLSKNTFRFSALNSRSKIIVVSVFLALIVSFLGALGPELAFDSLWYHLTLSKLYLAHQEIFFIPGGLLYYSAMPKLTELLFIPALAFGDGVSAKMIHFGFGILGIVVLYKLSSFFLDKTFSLLVVAILMSNLVFAWEMTTSYSDLTWLFYEVLAFLAFITFVHKKNRIFLLLCGVFIGCAITTKLVGVISIPVYLLLITYIFWPRVRAVVLHSGIVVIGSVLIPLPWLLFSYIHTANPFYPFFSGYLLSYENEFTLDFGMMFHSFVNTFLFPSDPLSPLYIIFLPLIFIVFKYFKKIERVVVLYCLGIFFLLLCIPKSGGGRFVLPYLPVYSLIVGLILQKLDEKKILPHIRTLSIVLVLGILFTTICYRGAASFRYLPYFLGQKTQAEFLTDNLEFSFSDFYDTDDFFLNTITPNDTVLLIGFHNLFYVNFPFVHQSWYKGEPITHVATQRSDLPDTYSDWELIYTNPQTFVNVYTRPER